MAPKRKLVSVIIPAFNAEMFIEQTIRSVMNQSYDEIEIIVVDDGSTDETGRIVERLQSEDPRIIYINQNNQGVSAARNNGFESSQGEYIAFLDADDIWLSENLEEKIKLFDADSELGLVHSDTAVIDEGNRKTGEVLRGKEGFILNDLLSWNGTCIPAPSSILLKRSTIGSIGLWDVNLSTSADKDYFFRIASKFKVGRLNRVTWYYRKHSSNMHLNISRMEKDEMYVYRKARKLGLFYSSSFRRKCLAKMHIVVAGSWKVDGNSTFKAILHVLRACLVYPPSFLNVLKKI